MYFIEFLAFVVFMFISDRGLQAKKPDRIAPSLITSTSTADWKLDSIMRFVLRGKHLCLGCRIDGNGYGISAPYGHAGSDMEAMIISAPQECWEMSLADMKHLKIKTARDEDVHFEIDQDTGTFVFATTKVKPMPAATWALPAGTEGVVATWDNGAVVLEHFVITSIEKCPIIEVGETDDTMFCAEHFDNAIRKINVGGGATFFIKHDGKQLTAGTQTVYNEATGGNAFIYAKVAYELLNQDGQDD